MSEVPEEAVKAIARQVFYAERGVDWEFEWADNTKRADARQRAMNLALIGILSALPHLRVQETPKYIEDADDDFDEPWPSGLSPDNPNLTRVATYTLPHPRPVVDREAVPSDPHGMREYADWLIKRHATDVEYLSVHEMAEEFYGDGTELTDDEARSVHDLVCSAKVTATWAEAQPAERSSSTS